MRTNHWKMFPLFLLGLAVLLTVGGGVGITIGGSAAFRKLHWGIWLVLTLVCPVLSWLLHCRAEGIRSLYPVSYLLNAVGAGCAFGIVLGFLEVPVQQRLGHLAVSAVFPALTALVMCAALTFWRRIRWISIGFTILVLPAVLACLLLGRNHGVITLGGVFGFLFFAAMPVACGRVRSGEDWLEQLSFCGFGAYVIVLMGAICMLLEDGPDGLVEGLFEGVAEFAEPSVRKSKQHP